METTLKTMHMYLSGFLIESLKPKVSNAFQAFGTAVRTARGETDTSCTW